MLLNKCNGSILFLLVIPLCLLSQTVDNLSQGNELYRKGDYYGAIQSYQKAIKNSENPAFSWFNLGNAYYQSGKPQKTVYCYERALAEAPDFERGWINLGVLYYELGDRSASIAALERVRTLNSQEPRIYLVLANAYKDLQHYSNAVICLEKALELDSSQIDAYLMLADLALMTGDNHEALLWLSKYPEHGPRYLEALISSCDIKVETGDTTGGLEILRRCIRDVPEKMSIWFKFVELLYHSGAVYTAILEAQRALSVNNSFTALALFAGTISFENGYYDKAEEFFRIAYAQGEPEGAVGLGNLLKVYGRFNDTDGIRRVRSVINDVIDFKRIIKPEVSSGSTAKLR